MEKTVEYGRKLYLAMFIKLVMRVACTHSPLLACVYITIAEQPISVEQLLHLNEWMAVIDSCALRM